MTTLTFDELRKLTNDEIMERVPPEIAAVFALIEALNAAMWEAADVLTNDRQRGLFNIVSDGGRVINGAWIGVMCEWAIDNIVEPSTVPAEHRL